MVNTKTYYVDEMAKEQISFWSLSILLDLNGHREFIDKDGDLNDTNLSYFLDLDDYAEDKMKYERKDVVTFLNNSLNNVLEQETFSMPDILSNNLEKIQDMLQLSPVERDILIFTIYIHYYEVFDSAGDTLGHDLASDRIEHILSVVLGYSKSDVKYAFSPKSRLSQSGLVVMDRSGTQSLMRKLDVLSDEFIDKMMTLDDEIEEMIKELVKKCEPTLLDMNDFTHLKTSLNLMLPYLTQAIQTKQKGVNILLYGVPGTGKTELTKAIAAELQTKIYEVSYSDENDEPIEGSKRLKAYKLAQSFFAQKKLLLMFDEVEDVFSNDGDMLFFTPKRQKNKAWINRMLETNAIPTIWITNDVKSIDKAIVRRFDMSIEVPIPPKDKRQEIIKNYSAGLLSKEAIIKIAQDEHIAPALISRAAKVVQNVKNSTEDTSKAFEQVLNNTLKAQGYTQIKEQSEFSLPKSYDPSLNNTNLDLRKLAEGIKQNPSARLCFYGVPGTGKSAFGKWLAQELDKPFLLKKGSDLISMWVGGTEKNIANAFEEAKNEDAILVFDEVDSFLQDRRTAKQSWEVTQVNEMLVQMENYNGIFIATTNLMEGLDQASLRRFDLKLEFGYLKKEQALELFLNEAKHLKLRKPSVKVQQELQKIKNLAPGDFAAISRQNRFNPICNAMDLVERLKEECAIKDSENNVNVMGFIAS
ncbi:MAG: AAA family ATPase [Arcobacter sp.]|nr:MAG: AAA family ATPase [Arcobacter sp.]